jgi:hypothetical protein
MDDSDTGSALTDVLGTETLEARFIVPAELQQSPNDEVTRNWCATGAAEVDAVGGAVGVDVGEDVGELTTPVHSALMSAPPSELKSVRIDGAIWNVPSL